VRPERGVLRYAEGRSAVLSDTGVSERLMSQTAAAHHHPNWTTRRRNCSAASAFACGVQAATAPTVTVSCPARTAAAPDCSLNWLVAFVSRPHAPRRARVGWPGCHQKQMAAEHLATALRREVAGMGC
jgi:hypothetical protein